MRLFKSKNSFTNISSLSKMQPPLRGKGVQEFSFNGHKTPFSLFSNIGASVQKQQQWKQFNNQTKNILRKFNIDRDNDGVPDKWDCQPLNSKKQDTRIYLSKAKNKNDKIAYVYKKPKSNSILIGSSLKKFNFDDNTQINAISEIINHEELHKELNKFDIDASSKLDNVAMESLVYHGTNKLIIPHNLNYNEVVTKKRRQEENNAINKATKYLEEQEMLGQYEGASEDRQNEWKNFTDKEKHYARQIGKDTDNDGVPDTWDCEPLNPKKQEFTHQYSFSSVAQKDIKTVMMPPEVFLKHTYIEAKEKDPNYRKSFDEYKEQVIHKSNVDFLKKAIPSKVKRVAIPFLEFDKWARPIGHEGRHTAVAASQLGMKTIPVTIERRRIEGRYDKEPEKWQLNEKGEVDHWTPIENYTPFKEQYVEEEFVYPNIVKRPYISEEENMRYHGYTPRHKKLLTLKDLPNKQTGGRIIWGPTKKEDVVKYMTPQEYLEKTGKLSYYERDYYDTAEKQFLPVEKLTEKMIQGAEIEPLELYNNEKGITQQQGRHRALAAKMAGEQFIPVIVQKNLMGDNDKDDKIDILDESIEKNKNA